MDETVLLTHLGVFLLGVATWLPFTLWEGRQINQRGEHPVSDAKSRHSTLSRSQTVGVIIVLASLLILTIGWQQVSFQHRFQRSADCYERWGKDVTKTIEARSNANASQVNADHVRDDAVDNILLLFLTFRKTKPPLPLDQREQKFGQTLDDFADAKAKQVKAASAAEKAKRDNSYPTLDCNG